MPDRLDWFQARALALAGTPIRRESWQRWHTYKPSLFLWFCHSEGAPATTTTPAVAPIASHVVLSAEHVAADFLARDWTTRHWLTPPDPQPDPGSTGGGGSTGGVIIGPDAPTDGGTTGGVTPGAGGTTGGVSPGGGWGGGGNRPGPGGDDGTGGGGGSAGGGDEQTGGDPGGNDPGNTPKPAYTPTVTLTLDPGTLDGPGCFIRVPQEGRATVAVSIPNPAGGKLKVVTVSVACLGETKLATVGPGASQTFQFTGPINPGGEITARATASGGTGQSWTGTNKKTWPKICLLPTLTWTGNRTITQTCTTGGSGSPTTGYTQTDVYSTTAQYAVNPTPGAGKTGADSGADFNDGDNWTTQVTANPSGTVTKTTSFLAPPASITCTVAANGTISAVSPAKLNLFPTSANGSVTAGQCTTVTNGSETGPA